MAAPRRTRPERREPYFDDASRRDHLRLDPRDRPATGYHEDDEAPRPRRARPEREPQHEDRRPPQRRRKRGGPRGGAGAPGRSFFGRLFYWGFVLSLWGALGLAAIIGWYASHLPPIQSLEVPKRPPTVQIVAADGRLLATRGEMGGAAVSLKDLPPYLPKAFVAIEDRRFYSHFGVDPVGIGRAVVANLSGRRVAQGGSTLTQQLAKNLFLTPERSMERKVQELVLALWLEHTYTKNEILELYINRVYFGAGAYGVEAAMQRYFGKPASQASVAEAAMLAGLVQAPSRLAPTRNPEGAEARAQLVVAAMREQGFIDERAAKLALMRPAEARRAPAGGGVNYVADWVMDVLDDLVGRFESDLVVRTTIDPVAQTAAERALIEEIGQKGAALDVTQGALVAMSPDGAVRALVGGVDYAASQYNRAVAARRQPGSAFKPFVYLAALEAGMTPETIREDRPFEVRGWRPENYSRDFFGPVSLTRALALSLNTVAARLTQEVGPKRVVSTARRLGITSRLEAVPSIGLGTSEVSVLELTGAYAAFANGGAVVVPQVIEQVRTAQGQTLFRRTATTYGRVIDPNILAAMNMMMQETLLTGTGRKAELPGWPAAGKTGTSQDFRDAWFVGYTAHLVGGVWLGNDDNRPTKRASGGGLPVDIWSRFMRQAHSGVPVAALPGTISPRAATVSAPADRPMRPPAPIEQDPTNPIRDPNERGILETWFGRRS
jgi:penicillin-binding protein 1A